MSDEPTDHLALWYEKYPHSSDYPTIKVNWPARVDARVEPGWTGTNKVALLNLGGVEFRHQLPDLRLMLHAALQALDMAEEALDE